MSFSKSWNCTSRFGECNFAFWKTHKCKLIPSWTRKTVWLPLNNIHQQICVKDVLNFTDSELSSQFCARSKPQVILIITQSTKNCAIIAPSRARAWFENKRFDWLSVNFFVHWPIRMLALLPFFAFNYLFSAQCLGKTALFSANQNRVIFWCILLVE